VVHQKSNLAPSGPAQTFGLDPVSGFYWAGETDATADEVMNGKQHTRPENKSTATQTFIRSILQNGAVPSADILELATERGITEKTLQRAKSDLCVYSRKVDGVWYWELPIEGVFAEVVDNEHGQNYQDGHCTPMAMLVDMTTVPEAATGQVNDRVVTN
jgi:hypothetical protein